MNISGVNQFQPITEGIDKMNELLKKSVDESMKLQDKMIKVNVREQVAEATNMGKNMDVLA